VASITSSGKHGYGHFSQNSAQGGSMKVTGKVKLLKPADKDWPNRPSLEQWVDVLNARLHKSAVSDK
jgi:hypothetical protein